ERFKELAFAENLEATVVARVTEEPTLKMTWNGKQIVHLSRAFLDSNGAEKHITVAPAAPEKFVKEIPADFKAGYMDLAQDLNICSKRGLSERFDSTIGAGTVLMPFGGKNQKTPIQAMVNKVSVEKKDTTTCSLMAWGYNPFIAEKSPYHSAYLAVVESVAKLIATGADFKEVYLSFQEYFEKLGKDEKRWGKPLAALLGAFMAQKGLEIAAIGGKDSMSGSFENIDVPPTLVSFAVTVDSIKNIISPEFKAAGHKVVLVKPEYDAEGLPTTDSLKALFDQVTGLMRSGKVAAAYTPTLGGVAEAVLKMSMGNDIGFTYADGVSKEEIFGYNYGAFVLELTEDVEIGTVLGTTGGDAIVSGADSIALADIFAAYENKLEEIFPMNVAAEEKAEIPTFTTKAEGITYKAKAPVAKPRVLIPVFPGTNCEFDSAKAVERAGAEANIFVINNLSAATIADSIERFAKEMKQSQTIFIPGGFSGGDEPDGSAKFITAFFRNPEIKEEVAKHLNERDGLMIGICNGFQALIKLGLVPFGEIIETDETCPTLSYNTISRHQSKIVRVRLATEKSPW
ncbi:MAG: phosphoribosylformylglycinamidine synthase subunit PurQ, partial [Anaerotignum sp.]|nr:phosphoribosylformylglycinamidine synthase subunit PurQ [Anaerotignum sp.]